MARPLDTQNRSSARSLSCGKWTLPIGERTLVMGILNVTPDSFYDGGRYQDPEIAVRRVREMVEAGADIIDIGGQSVRPFSEPVSKEEELARVKPVLDQIECSIEIPVSIDTYNSDVARYAISKGAAIVNDVTALTSDPDMLPVVAGEGAGVILMHMRGEPKTMQEDTHYDDVVAEVKCFLGERADAAKAAGVDGDRIAVDPGIGFGKSVEGNLRLLHDLRDLRELGYPVLVGASRKTFIGRVLDSSEEERLEGSLGAAAAAAMSGADIVRVHDVAQTVRVLRVVDAVRFGGAG